MSAFKPLSAVSQTLSRDLAQMLVIYRIELGRTAWYIGETRRSGYERGGEHYTKSLNQAEAFYLSKHGWEEHGLEAEMTPRFRMTVTRFFRNTMQQQIAQAVAIEMAKPDYLLNSKSEWGFPRIPRLRI